MRVPMIEVMANDSSTITVSFTEDRKFQIDFTGSEADSAFSTINIRPFIKGN
jgi:hypothetical protein